MIQNVFSLLALIAAGWLIFGNWSSIVLFLLKRKHSSWIPIIGGGVGCLGCLLSPYAVLNKLWWVPLLLDWGCVPGLSFSAIYFAISFIRRFRTRK
jgi:hypothetical protein